MSGTFSALQLFSTLALGEGLKEKDTWSPWSILVEIHVIYMITGLPPPFSHTVNNKSLGTKLALSLWLHNFALKSTMHDQ